MNGKQKTLLMIIGIAIVYMIVLNVVLNNRNTASDPGGDNAGPSDNVGPSSNVGPSDNAGPSDSAPPSDNAAPSDDGGSPAQAGIIGTLAVGNVVTFGSYEQDGDLSNGKEPLEWDVIARDGNRYLLITHYVIDGKKYDDGSADTTIQANENASAAQVTWEKSSIRRWLNGDFYTTAFTGNEQAQILRVHLKTPNFSSFDTGYLGYTSSSSKKVENGLGGKDTDDYVFLLSYEEFVQCFQPEKSVIQPLTRMQCGKAIVSPTEYAKMQGVSCKSLARDTFYTPGTGLSPVYTEHLQKDVNADYEENGYICSWLTRSPGCYTDGTAVLMIVSGYTCFAPGTLKTNVNGIRPAVWVTG